MAEKDALGSFDYSGFTGAGLYLKFEPGKPIVIRILTIDPVISESEFTDKRTGEVKLNTRFAFIIYNFTAEKAQIMQVTPKTAERISQIHLDEAFGANIRNVDVRITPPEKGEIKAYLIEALPQAHALNRSQVEEAKTIDLDNSIKDSKGRMSAYNQDMAGNSESSGYSTARAQADKLKPSKEAPPEDIVIEDIGDEPINLDDIPF